MFHAQITLYEKRTCEHLSDFYLVDSDALDGRLSSCSLNVLFREQSDDCLISFCALLVTFLHQPSSSALH